MFWERSRFHAAVIACAIAVGAAGASAGNNQRRAEWTHYRNARWAFCVDYPAGWKATVLTDGSGVTLHPDPEADPGSRPYISISGLPDQPDVDNANVVLDDSPPLNLEGNFARSMESLREYERASDIRVLEKRKLEFQGFDALSTSIRYRTPGNGGELADETPWINKEYIIFTLTLLGRPRQVRELKPIYRDILRHRFNLECGAGRSQ